MLLHFMASLAILAVHTFGCPSLVPAVVVAFIFDLLFLNCGNQNVSGARSLLIFVLARRFVVFVSGCVVETWKLIVFRKLASMRQ